MYYLLILSLAFEGVGIPGLGLMGIKLLFSVSYVLYRLLRRSEIKILESYPNSIIWFFVIGSISTLSSSFFYHPGDSIGENWFLLAWRYYFFQVIYAITVYMYIKGVC